MHILFRWVFSSTSIYNWLKANLEPMINEAAPNLLGKYVHWQTLSTGICMLQFTHVYPGNKYSSELLQNGDLLL